MSEVYKFDRPVITLKIDTYISTSDIELLEMLIQKLESQGFGIPNPVFSGFDGSFIKKGEPYPDSDAMFAMNVVGWREAVNKRDLTPADYADGYNIACIGVFDGNLLKEAYCYDFDENINGRMIISDIELGDALGDISPERGVQDVVISIDYPTGTVGQALICLVLLER